RLCAMSNDNSNNASTPTEARFVHEDGRGGQKVVPSPFESEGDDAVKSFIDLRSYWASQATKGGEAAALAREAEAFLRRGRQTREDTDVVMNGNQVSGVVNDFSGSSDNSGVIGNASNSAGASNNSNNPATSSAGAPECVDWQWPPPNNH
ncbi:hypothetical protein EDD11_010549, partial [Mortierella claussenii]